MPSPRRDAKSNERALLTENAELRARLEDLEHTLDAIRTDVVDAFVVETARGPEVFVLQSLDRESSRLREEILAHVNDAVIVADETGCVLYLNRAAERQYGLVSSEVLGKRVSTLYGVRWPRPGDATESAATLRATGGWRGEKVHLKQNGEAIEVEIAISTLPLGGDGRLGKLMVIRDVSELRRIERSRAQIEARLFAAERWQAISALAARVAAEPDARGPAVDLAREIAAYSAASMAGETLISIPSIVEESARLLRAGPPGARRIESSSEPDTPLVRGDAVQLLQVILSVGNNAADAMQGRPGAVVIRASGITVGGDAVPSRNGLADGRYARVEVSDTGRGMDIATLRRIFEPSFTTKPEGRGSGMGLCEVRKWLRRHHGELFVQSEIGKGSRFEFLLPDGGGGANGQAATP